MNLKSVNPLVVFDIGATKITPLLQLLQRLSGTPAWEVSILQTGHTHDLLFDKTSLSVSELANKFACETISAVRLTARGDFPRAHLFAPWFDQIPSKFYHLALDYEGLAAEANFFEILEFPELCFVAMSEEEGIDELPGGLSPEDFPWQHWQLIQAAVFSGKDGKMWELRRNQPGWMKG